ncbi:ATP-binding cassette domain-containing protein [Nonomuraea sp. NPDC048826]|uniref:ATP-binding cassette domain-containing protein n=1 Tax=Nonomuraea sp. NPDC048826 TaxID=3364347 RepID=UPI003719E6D1
MPVSHPIETRGLRKSFGDVAALESVDLKVERGMLLALLGPNGAGKTTVVRILSTLLRADGGVALVNGHDVAKDPRAVRRAIGLTGQETALDTVLTGRENLEMIGRLLHLGRPAATKRAIELLELFGLVDAADREVRTYSGGMRRKLDLAVSLIGSPPVLYLDEPTTGLDPTSREAMWETITKLTAGGTTILLTTQYLEEADQLADRVAVLNHGRIIAENTAQELKRQVGPERAELTVAADDADRLRAFLDGESVDAQTVSVPVYSPGDVRDLLNRTAEAGFEIQQIALRQPTLDDVFRMLTSTPKEGVK